MTPSPSRTEPADPGLNDLHLSNIVGTAGWRLFHCELATSTNDLARELGPWNAVRATAQTGGRGRFGRSFVSEPGGLWISAVLPAEGGPQRWAGFSLMVGCHLVQMLEAFGVPGCRLRWPNDLMSGRRKLAGLLIEQAPSGTLVVGFGLNVTNRPWESHPELAPIASSLENELRIAPGLDELTGRTLDALADAHLAMTEGGMEAAILELNDRWSVPIPVEITLSSGGIARGRFAGLDPRGNLRLIDASDQESLVGHQSVERLVELI